MAQSGASEPASGNATPLSPGLSALAQKEMEWANAGEKLAVLNFSEKVIEEKERHLRECIANNYTRIKDVERELGGLQMQLKLSTGPKKSALMMIRKKIELQNERVLAARDRQRAAKKVFETAEEALKAEEQVKERLCQELNLLVQQSAHAQLEKLEQLTERLERMNQSVGHSSDKERQQEEEVTNLVMESLRRVPAPQQPTPPAAAAEEALPAGPAAATEPLVATAGDYTLAGEPAVSRAASPAAGAASQLPAGADASPQHSRQARQQPQPQQSTPRKPTLQTAAGSGSAAASPAHAAAARARHVPLAPVAKTVAAAPAAAAVAPRPPPSSGFRGFDT